MVDICVLEDGETRRDLLDRVHALVDAAFGGAFSEEDWAHTSGGWRVIAFDDLRPVAHAAVVPRTIHVAGRPFATGYVEGVASSTDRQNQRLGP